MPRKPFICRKTKIQWTDESYFSFFLLFLRMLNRENINYSLCQARAIQLLYSTWRFIGIVWAQGTLIKFHLHRKKHSEWEFHYCLNLNDNSTRCQNNYPLGSGGVGVDSKKFLFYERIVNTDFEDDFVLFVIAMEFHQKGSDSLSQSSNHSLQVILVVKTICRLDRKTRVFVEILCESVVTAEVDRHSG